METFFLSPTNMIYRCYLFTWYYCRTVVTSTTFYNDCVVYNLYETNRSFPSNYQWNLRNRPHIGPSDLTHGATQFHLVFALFVMLMKWNSLYLFVADRNSNTKHWQMSHTSGLVTIIRSSTGILTVSIYCMKNNWENWPNIRRTLETEYIWQTF